MNSIDEVKTKVKEFVESRDWDKFHTPENLVKSISIESGELLECFQWNDDFDLESVCDELADILIYCIILADKLDVEIVDIIEDKF